MCNYNSLIFNKGKKLIDAIKINFSIFFLIGLLIFFNCGVFNEKDKDETSTKTSYYDSLIADFNYRDTLQETDVPESEWSLWEPWGPPAAHYPAVAAPSEFDNIKWYRDRVIEVAKKYIGLAYMHKHIPSQGGLDCSNFTSWVYNYGFGIIFTSDVVEQAASSDAGRLLDGAESLAKGDLLFIWNSSFTSISHVAIYIDENTLIDSTIDTVNGVAVRSLSGWYKIYFSHARRIFE